MWVPARLLIRWVRSGHIVRTQNLFLSHSRDARGDQDQMIAHVDSVDHHDREETTAQWHRQA